jgi:glucosamine 6-phosphate synthetase-like amidotransferase/phosphosugar isomerase protein
MCGIFGWIKPKIKSDTDLDLREALIKGLVQTQTRGTDATGIYTTDHGIIKTATKAADFVVDHVPDNISECRFVIGHCRAATMGDSKLEKNAHPFESKNWILVHNGVVRMKSIKGYKYSSDVDSEVLLSHIETNGVTKGIRTIDGSAALVLYNKKTNKLLFWTDSSRPLAIAYYHGIIFFASTKSIIRNTLKIKNDLGIFPKISFATIYEYELLEFDLTKNVFIRKAEIEPAPKYEFEEAFQQVISDDNYDSPIPPTRAIITKGVTYGNYDMANSLSRPPLQKGCWVSNRPKG